MHSPLQKSWPSSRPYNADVHAAIHAPAMAAANANEIRPLASLVV